MSNRRTCSECGALLTEDLPQGPCPVCVAQGALALSGGGSAGVIAEEPGEQIGPSKVLNELGDGGIGFLLLAKQAEPLRRRVALTVNKPAQARRKRWMCAGHPVVGEAISALAAALERQASLTEAATNRRDALSLRQKLLPADWLTVDARCRLGGILVGRKAFAKDEPLLLSGYRGVKEHEAVIPSRNKSHLKKAIQSSVRISEASGGPDFCQFLNNCFDTITDDDDFGFREPAQPASHRPCLDGCDAPGFQDVEGLCLRPVGHKHRFVSKLPRCSELRHPVLAWNAGMNLDRKTSLGIRDIIAAGVPHPSQRLPGAASSGDLWEITLARAFFTLRTTVPVTLQSPPPESNQV